MPVLDLRSDTFTKPSDAMRKVMAEAEVGDDVFGEDPTVNELQIVSAEMTGKEKALYVSSGTQSNLCALMATCWERGSEIFVGDKAHIALYEQGNVAQFGGILVRTVPNLEDGSFDLDYLATLIHTVDDAHFPRAQCICIEVSHNMMGGAVPSINWLREVRTFADKYGLRIHMDAARGFNAAVYLGISIKELCSFADSVSICTSKGLAAPVGSVLCADANLISKAHRMRKALGGGMRQAGIIAAGSLYALTTMSKRIYEDNNNAKRFADIVSKYDFVNIDMNYVHTNIVRFKLKGFSHAEFIERCATQDIISVLLLNVSGGYLRVVFHNDSKGKNVDLGAEKLKKVLDNMC